MLQEIERFNLVKFSAANMQTAENLKQRLKEGIPIGSKRQHTEEEIREALSKLTATSQVSECESALEMLKEVPVRVAEVLCAGWIAANERKTVLLSEAFSKSQDEDIFRHMEKDLEYQDSLLMKSIEILSVMRTGPSVTERS